MGPEGITPPEVQAAAEEEERKRREEEEAAQQQQAAPAPTPAPRLNKVATNQAVEPKRGILERLGLRRRRSQTVEEAQKEAAGFESKVDQALETGKIPEERGLTQKEIHEMMLDPNKLPELMQRMNLEEFRRMKLVELHGSGTIGKTKQFFSGDSAIEYTGEQDIVKTNARKDIKRRATAVGLKTLPAAVAAVFTGGAAVPAVGAILGSMVGAGGAEAWEKMAGQGQGIREEIAKVIYHDWVKLKDWAEQYKNAANEEEKYKCLELITQKFHESSGVVKKLHGDFLQDRKRWEWKKGLVTFAFGAAGLAAGAAWGSFRMDLDKVPQAVLDKKESLIKVTHHSVKWIDGAFRFLYDQSEQAAKSASGRLWGELGSKYAGQAAWEISKRGLAVLGANLVTGLSLGLFRRGEKKGFEEDFERVQAEQERIKKVWQRRMPEMPAAVKAERAAGGGGAAGATGAERAEGGGEAGPKIPEKFIKMAEEEGKSLPEEGKIWLYFVPGEGWAVYRIKKIHYESTDCPVELELLDMDFQNANKIDNVNLEDLLRRGQFRSEFVNDWLLTVKKGQQIRLKGGQLVRNLNDKGQIINVGEGQHEDFEFERVPDRPHALLKKAGEEDKRVSIFDLAFWGVSAVGEKSKEREKS